MQYLKNILLVLVISVFAVSCKSDKKGMTMEDFVKIDLEIASSNQKPEKKKEITKKYGYTLEQYNEFAKKVNSDPKLKEKLGEKILDKYKPEKK